MNVRLHLLATVGGVIAKRPEPVRCNRPECQALLDDAVDGINAERCDYCERHTCTHCGVFDHSILDYGEDKHRCRKCAGELFLQEQEHLRKCEEDYEAYRLEELAIKNQKSR